MKKNMTLYTKYNGALHLTIIEWCYALQSDKYILHRTDGPALIRDNGFCMWYWNNKIHRFGGYAVTWIGEDNNNQYFLDGVYYKNSEEYWKTVKEIKVLPKSLKLIHQEQWIRELE